MDGFNTRRLVTSHNFNRTTKHENTHAFFIAINSGFGAMQHEPIHAALFSIA